MPTVKRIITAKAYSILEQYVHKLIQIAMICADECPHHTSLSFFLFFFSIHRRYSVYFVPSVYDVHENGRENYYKSKIIKKNKSRTTSGNKIHRELNNCTVNQMGVSSRKDTGILLLLIYSKTKKIHGWFSVLVTYSETPYHVSFVKRNK